jgi:hypothetical protein
MPRLTRRRQIIAALLAGLVVVIASVLYLSLRPDLKSRLTLVRVGMSREQVEGLLGRPELVLDRTDDRGTFLCWTDQFWQADVIFGRDGLVESIGCKPSDSATRQLERTLIRLFK